MVYQALNPPYHQWPERFPALQNSVISAARACGATLISMENLYMFGATGGAAMSEDTPLAPNTRKGEVRANMTRELAAAHGRGEIRAASVRASDFFGPRVLQSALGDRVFARILDGKTAQVLGDPELPHAYTYVGDIARALVLVGNEPSAWGKAWHVPSDETTTTRQIVAMIGEVAGVPARATATPKLLCESWDDSIRKSENCWRCCMNSRSRSSPMSSALQARFGFRPTPLRDALEATIDWYRNRFDR